VAPTIRQGRRAENQVLEPLGRASRFIALAKGAPLPTVRGILPTAPDASGTPSVPPLSK
jgi:hypothetical protein